jgi:hypothetical protein
MFLRVWRDNKRTAGKVAAGDLIGSHRTKVRIVQSLMSEKLQMAWCRAVGFEPRCLFVALQSRTLRHAPVRATGVRVPSQLCDFWIVCRR